MRQYGPGTLDHAVQGGRHPQVHRVKDPPLHVFDGLTGISLVPEPIEILSGLAELDDEVGGQVLRLGLPALFPPEAEQGGLVVAHDDPGVGAADEVAAAKALRNVANWL